MKSISFDRAAHFYDDTRSYPSGVSDQIAETTLAMLPPRADVLEIGIGTGRISGPLNDRQVNIYGIDISSKMINRFLEKIPPASPLPKLTLGDAAKLPFVPKKFDAVLAVHVFHLIAQWQEAVSEAVRTLKPDGILLAGYDWRPTDSPIAAIRGKWRGLLQTREREREHPGPKNFDELIGLLVESGAQMTEIEAAHWSKTVILEEYIASLEAGIYSSTWSLSAHELSSAIAELRRWALEQFGDLSRPYVIPRKFIWQRFEWARKK